MTTGGSLLFVVLFAVVGGLAGCSADASWKGSGPPAATSLKDAPVLSASHRVRGRFESGQALYLRVDPAARNRLGYAIDAVGTFDVEEVLTSGKSQLVTSAETHERDRPSWLPSWLVGPGSWGHGGQLGDVAYFVVRPGSGATGAYEFTLYEGSMGYQP